MTIETPLWMQGIAGVPSFSARVDRMLFAQLWDEGVMDLTALKVSQRAAGANYTVDVSIGEAVVVGDDQVNQGNYLARCTVIENKAVTAAPGSNSRYDIVCLKINDPNAGGPAGSTGTIVVTAGVVAAAPVVPATPVSSLLLAIIGPITSGTASITNAIITDARIVAGRRATPGAIEWQSNAVAPSGWIFAAGQAVSRATYARLFAHIATTFGVGDGSTTFNVPDLRGRTPVGLDNMGGIDAARLSVANTLGLGGGEELHVLSVAETPVKSHVHSIAHDHAAAVAPVLAADGGGGLLGDTSIAIGGGPNGTTRSVASVAAASAVMPFLVQTDLPNYAGNSGATADAAATAHNVMQPYVLLNALIRT